MLKLGIYKGSIESSASYVRDSEGGTTSLSLGLTIMLTQRYETGNWDRVNPIERSTAFFVLVKKDGTLNDTAWDILVSALGLKDRHELAEVVDGSRSVSGIEVRVKVEMNTYGNQSQPRISRIYPLDSASTSSTNVSDVLKKFGFLKNKPQQNNWEDERAF